MIWSRRADLNRGPADYEFLDGHAWIVFGRPQSFQTLFLSVFTEVNARPLDEEIA